MYEESGGFSSRQVMHSGFCLITLVAKVWGEGLEEEQIALMNPFWQPNYNL